jgi:hypothetical protein
MFIGIVNAIRGISLTFSQAISSLYITRVESDGGYIEATQCMLDKLSDI